MEKADSITLVQAQGAAELIRHAQLVHGERFLQTLFQAARRARIQVHQLAVPAP